MDTLWRDIRQVSRALLRTPGFLMVSVLTLALGIGATTAIFTVMDGVLLSPLPYPQPERIVRLWELNGKGGRMNFSDPDFADVRDRSRSFAAVAEVANAGMVSVAGPAEPVRAQAAVVSSQFFKVMGVAPLRGRLFAADEQREDGTPAVVVSEDFWRRSLGGAPLGPGTTLTFDNRVYGVVGVMPAVLDYPAGTQIWAPRELDASLPSRTAHNYQVLARLAPDVSPARAQTELRTIARQLQAQYGDVTDMADAGLVPLREQTVGPLRPMLLALLAASGFLLLIACANVVNLLMARMAAREGEWALRVALGATRRRLAQQLVAQALVLALAGGALGLVLAGGGVRALLALEPGNLPRAGEIHLRWEVLLFALAVALVAAIGMGLLTAWRAGRGDVRAALAESRRTQSGSGASARLRSGLVIGQVAATLVLLVGAGLLARSFIALLRVDPGFRTEKALVVGVSLPYASSEAGQRRNVAFYNDLIRRLGSLPGVGRVGAVNHLPLAESGGGNGTFLILPSADVEIDPAALEPLMRDPSHTGNAEFRVASGDYFRAMNIPLIRGRLFDDRDAPDAPHAALISASLAATRWPGENPLGKVIEFGNMDGDLRPFTVVGVVGDVRETSLADPPQPTFYAFYRQRPAAAATMDVVMQTPAETAPLITAARRAVRELRPDVPPRVRSIESVVSGSVARRRFALVLVGAFGAAALLLATLGVYGVVSYLVTQRRQEMAVRIALGAQSGEVVRLVVRQGVVLAVAGVVIGSLAAAGLTRLIAGMLFGVSATDPLAFGAVAAGLLVVAIAASAVPARRAARIDPMTILRGA